MSVDFKLTVEYYLPNVCEQNELEDKSPYQIYCELSEDCRYHPGIFSSDSKVISVEVVNENPPIRKLILNSIQCNVCGEILVSYNRHHFDACKCFKNSENSGCAVDGGLEYRKRSGGNYTELSVYSDVPFEVIRKLFHRGGHGADGKAELKYVPLNEMSNEWLTNCVAYCEKYNADDYYTDLYRQELIYREKNSIFINDGKD